MINKELLLFIGTDFSLIVNGSKISDMLVSITFNQLYLHFGKGKSILFEYAFKPIQTRGLFLPLLMLKATVCDQLLQSGVSKFVPSQYIILAPRIIVTAL